jgi:MFS family permease
MSLAVDYLFGHTKRKRKASPWRLAVTLCHSKKPHLMYFILLALATAISLLGDTFYALVIPEWIIKATGLAKSAALVSGTGSVIGLLISPFAGTLADRHDRRQMMIAADTVRGVLVSVLYGP